MFCCECNSRQEWASCHRGKRCLSPGMSAVDHQRISPWGCPNNPGGSDGTNSPPFQPPGESENVEEMTIPIARSPQRRGWEALGAVTPGRARTCSSATKSGGDEERRTGGSLTLRPCCFKTVLTAIHTTSERRSPCSSAGSVGTSGTEDTAGSGGAGALRAAATLGPGPAQQPPKALLSPSLRQPV